MLEVPAVDVEVVAREDRRADARNSFLEGALAGFAERKTMIDQEHDLPITRQAETLNVSRGSVYYLPRPVPEADAPRSADNSPGAIAVDANW